MEPSREVVGDHQVREVVQDSQSTQTVDPSGVRKGARAVRGVGETRHTSLYRSTRGVQRAELQPRDVSLVQPEKPGCQ